MHPRPALGGGFAIPCELLCETESVLFKDVSFGARKDLCKTSICFERQPDALRVWRFPLEACDVSSHSSWAKYCQSFDNFFGLVTTKGNLRKM